VRRKLWHKDDKVKVKQAKCGKIDLLVVDDGILPISTNLRQGPISEEPKTVLSDAVIPDITANQIQHASWTHDTTFVIGNYWYCVGCSVDV
jgi:hypothetical protein